MPPGTESRPGRQPAADLRAVSGAGQVASAVLRVRRLAPVRPRPADDVLAALDALWPPERAEAVGRRRHGLRRPGRPGQPGAVRRRPRPGGRRRGGAARRRPAGHPPPALPAGHHHGRRRHLQGPGGAHPDQQRRRPARRAHQRRHRRPRASPTPSPAPWTCGSSARWCPTPTDPAGRRGLGRVCELDRPADAARVRRARRRTGCPPPRRASGSRATRTRTVRTVAVSGGSGDSLFDAGPRGRRGRVPHRRPAPPPGLRGHRSTPRSRWSTPRTGPPSGPGASRPPPSSTRSPTATAGTCGSTSQTVTDPWTAPTLRLRPSDPPGAPN